MADYELYYWPVPFRGQFIRAILAYAGKSWTEHDETAIVRLMQSDAEDQPIGFMGPPVLIDKASGFALAQMPAITLYLGDRLGLLPPDPAARALSIKTVNDANDVLDEITLDGGRLMWTPETWAAFVPRLKQWMRIGEALGGRNGLTADAGFLLGTGEAGIADIVTATLWSTTSDRFPALAALLEETAPTIAGLTRRMQAVPALAALSDQAFRDYGDAYCGGEIETSLRAVVGTQAGG